MERREAPGRWRSALWRVWRNPPRAYGHSRLPGVTACEARAPNDVGRCASRRSTYGAIVGRRHPTPPTGRLMKRPRWIGRHGI